MKYKVFGPFVVPRLKGGKADRVNKSALKTVFWPSVEESCVGLKNAIGCYVFSIRAGKGVTPWYVGMTSNQKKGFESEVFQIHKLDHYNDVLNGIGKGTPILHFIARYTESGQKLSGQDSRKEIEWLETILISHAISANSQLKNIRNTKYLKDIVVPGIIDSGKGNKNAACRTLLSALKI